MPTPLDPGQAAQIDAADATQVARSLARFAGGGEQRWVPLGHQYPEWFPTDADFAQVPDNEIVDAIALRGPLHCIDGWSYLARAISALAAGDGHSARHFAYYGELRAALSILASNSIGSFNSKNRIIDRSGNLGPAFNSPTHKFSWLVLEHWGEQPATFEAIASALDIAGVTLFDAFTTFFSSPSSSLLASNVIKSWGFDLSNAHADSRHRNNSSYQPNELVSFATTAAEDVDFIGHFWRAFTPGSHNIERFLLRNMLETQAIGVLGRGSLAGRGVEYDRLDPRIHAVVSKAFLERSEEPDDHPILVAAADQSNPAQPRSMIARAALLLRLSTALVEARFGAASVRPREDLEFWWLRYGAERGFWNLATPPDDLSDLWTDVADALGEAQRIGSGERFALNDAPLGLPRLCEAERIALWSICR